MKAKLEWFEIPLADLPKLERLDYGLRLGQLLGSQPRKAGEKCDAGIVPHDKCWLFSHKTGEMRSLLAGNGVTHGWFSRMVNV